MQVLLPEMSAPIRIRAERPMNDDEFAEFCARNPALQIEREVNGDLIIMLPSGAETGFRKSDLTAQLTMWAKKDGRGRVRLQHGVHSPRRCCPLAGRLLGSERPSRPVQQRTERAIFSLVPCFCRGTDLFH